MGHEIGAVLIQNAGKRPTPLNCVPPRGFSLRLQGGPTDKVAYGLPWVASSLKWVAGPGGPPASPRIGWGGGACGLRALFGTSPAFS